MHETGAQWLMTNGLEGSPQMVAAVRTSMTIPVFCLALPAGVWADRFDRRGWLLGTQTLLACIAIAMTSMAYFELFSPTTLLLMTVLMGVATVLNQPAWQALTPELVPAALVPTAVAVGSISFNLARTIGPFMAGMLIAQFGEWAAFGFNAISFLGIIGVLLLWKPEPITKPKRPPKFNTELKKGVFLIQHSIHLKNALVRLFFFAMFASVLWSLLSLVSQDQLKFAERGFGLCLGLIGFGAVSGASVLPRLRMIVSSEGIMMGSQVIFGLLAVAIGLFPVKAVILPALFVLGVCWMASMTTLNATTQVNLPRKFRARGMAAFLMVFALGMAIGSFSWGWIGGLAGVGMAFIVAGVLLAITGVATLPLKIGSLVESR